MVEKYATPIQTRSKYKAAGEELVGQTFLPSSSKSMNEEKEDTTSDSTHSEEETSINKPETMDNVDQTEDLPFSEGDHWTYPATSKEATEEARTEKEHQVHLLVSIDEKVLQEFIEGYKEDSFLKSRYSDEVPSHTTVITPSHFRKGCNGLLYFFDADYNTKLCVP